MIKIKESIFGYEPNWIEYLKVAYTFVTVISNSRVLNEQRKSLSVLPVRSYDVNILTEHQEVNEILNWIRYWNTAQEQLVYMPLYNEPIRPTGTGNVGDTGPNHTVNTNDTSKYKNLHDYTKSVLFIDKLHIVPPAVEEPSEIGDTYMYFDITPGGGIPNPKFQAEHTIIYPVMKAIIADHSCEHVTSRWARITLGVQEVLDADPIVGIGGS